MSDKPTVTTLEERLAAAEALITEACCMANKKLGHKLRDHWIDNFNAKLKEYEARYGK